MTALEFVAVGLITVGLAVVALYAWVALRRAPSPDVADQRCSICNLRNGRHLLVMGVTIDDAEPEAPLLSHIVCPGVVRTASNLHRLDADRRANGGGA